MASCYSVSPFRRHDSRTRARNGEPNRGHLREEPYAGKPHVRICEGESRMAELLDHAPVAWHGKCVAEHRCALLCVLTAIRLGDSRPGGLFKKTIEIERQTDLSSQVTLFDQLGPI